MLKYISRSVVYIVTALCLFVGSCDLPLGVIPAAIAQTQSFVRADRTLTTATGQAIAGADVWILNQPTTSLGMMPSPLATVFGNATGTGGALTQPLKTDGNGRVFFYTSPGTVTILFRSPFIGQLVLADQNIPCAIDGVSCTAANVEVNGAEVPGIPNFTNSSSITFSNPFSGTVQAQAIPPSVNGVPIVGTPNFVNGANSTATSPAAGQIAINVPNPLLIQHNGSTSGIFQPTLNFQDATPNLPSGQQPVTFTTDTTGDLGAFVPPASAGFASQVVVPIVPGQNTATINATKFTTTSQTPVNVTGSNTSAQLTAVSCVPGVSPTTPSCQPGYGNSLITWSGFALPAGINPANVVAIQGYISASQSSVGNSGPSVGCNAGPSDLTDIQFNFNSEGNFAPLTELQTFNGGVVTAADIPNISCTAQLGEVDGSGPVSFNVFQLNLVVTYTGTPLPTPNVISISAPLLYSTASNILGFNPLYNYGIAGGTPSAYTLTLPALVASLSMPNLPPQQGQEVLFSVNNPFNASSAGATLDLNGSGAFPIVKAPGGTPIAAGDIGGATCNGDFGPCIADLIFDGEFWELQNPQTPGSAAPTGAAGGDLSGTYPDPTVSQIEGAVIPKSAPVVGTNGSGQLIAGPTSLPPNGTAGGDLSGTYPNPTVAKVNGAAVPDSAAYIGTNAEGQFVTAPAACALTGCTLTGSGNGMFTVDDTATSSQAAVFFSQPSLATGNVTTLSIGTALSTNNGVDVTFENVGGAGSSSNLMAINLVGDPAVTINAHGGVSIPEGISGTTSVTFTLGPTTVVGTGATVVCHTGVVCDQFSGTITLTTGTSAATAAGEVVTANFPVTRTNFPSCIFNTFNESAGVAVPNLDASPLNATGFGVFMPVASTLVSSSTYRIAYICGGI